MGTTQTRKKNPAAPVVAQYISQEDAAQRWGVHVDTIRRLISSGRVTGYRLNKRIIRVDVAEVDAAFKPIPVGGASA